MECKLFALFYGKRKSYIIMVAVRPDFLILKDYHLFYYRKSQAKAGLIHSPGGVALMKSLPHGFQFIFVYAYACIGYLHYYLVLFLTGFKAYAALFPGEFYCIVQEIGYDSFHHRLIRIYNGGIIIKIQKHVQVIFFSKLMSFLRINSLSSKFVLLASTRPC